MGSERETSKTEQDAQATKQEVTVSRDSASTGRTTGSFSLSQQAGPPALRLFSMSSAKAAETRSQTSKTTAAGNTFSSASFLQSEPIPTFKVIEFSKKATPGPFFFTSDEKLKVCSALLRSRATIEAEGNPSAISKWDVGYIQNVMRSKLRHTYKRTVAEDGSPAQPVSDSADPAFVPWYGNALAPANSGPITVRMEDVPSHFARWRDQWTDDPNSLLQTFREVLFKTWLVARHRLKGTIIFFKRFAWLIHYVVDVDPTKPTASRATKNPQSAGLIIRDLGEGEGSPQAVLTPPIANQLSDNWKLTVLPEKK